MCEVWETMDFESKSKLSKEVAFYSQKLSVLRFSDIGNLYFSKVHDRVMNRMQSPKTAKPRDGTKAHDKTMSNSENEPHNNVETNEDIQRSGDSVNVNKGIGDDDKFVIGRIVSLWFFRDRRAQLTKACRGPFSSSNELMTARAKIQIEFIRSFSSPIWKYCSEIYEGLAKNKKNVLKTCNHLKSLVPGYFSSVRHGKDINTLFHSDLSDRNIIVDPKTYRITGIID